MQRFRHPTEENTRTRVQFEGKVLRIKQSLDLKVNINWKELLPIPDGRDYPDNRGFSWHAKNGKKRKTSEDIVSKSCWAWRNVTLERGWSRISSLAILIRWAPFWPADMHTVHAREWRERLKPVTQPVWPVWLVQTPGQLITHTQQDIDTISSEVFLFSPFFACQGKPLSSG